MKHNNISIDSHMYIYIMKVVVYKCTLQLQK
jgi:hypothetical protein